MAGMVITRANFPAAADRALRMGFFQIPSGITMYRKRVFKSMTSDQAFEKFSRNAGFAMFDLKPEDSPAVADTTAQMYPKFIYHETYGKQLSITMEARQDDPKGVIKRVWETGSDLRGTMEYTLEFKHWSFINDHWTSNPTGDPFYTYNGTDYPILSETNPTLNSGVYTNRTDAAIEFNRASLQMVIQQMNQNPLNERGMIQGWVGTTLLVGVDDELDARAVVSSMKIPQSADNEDNVIRHWVKDYIAPNLFQNNGAWALLSDVDQMGFLTFMRMNIETEALSYDATLNTRKVVVFRNGRGGVHSKGIYGVPAG